jgi:O-antigen/teichoic acid export membrane protein
MIKFKTLKNISYYFLASLAKAAILLAINPFVALNMSHNDYAITGYFLSFNALILPILSFYFTQYYSKKYFEVNDSDRELLLRKLISIQFVMGLIELFFIFIFFYIFFTLNRVQFPVFPYAFLTCFTLFFDNLFTFWLLNLKMQRDAKKYFYLSLSDSVLSVSFVVLLVVVLKLGALGKLAAPLLASIFWGILYFRKTIKRIEFHFRDIKEPLKFCWPLIIAAMLEYFFSGVDRAMLEKVGNTRQLGLYNVAIGISSYLLIFNTAISDTFRPDIFHAVVQRNYKKIVKVVGGIQMLNTIPVVIFIIFAPFLIKILTYNRFTDAAGFARILALRNISRSIYYAMSSIIIAFGFPKVTLMTKVIGTFFSIAIFKYLIENYGYYGAAWGQVLSFLVLAVPVFLFILYKIWKQHGRGRNSRLT